MDVNLRDSLWQDYLFFGPLFSIGGFGAALPVLLPPFLDISGSSPVGYVVLPLFRFRGVSGDSSWTAAAVRSAAAVASVWPTIMSMTPYCRAIQGLSSPAAAR